MYSIPNFGSVPVRGICKTVEPVFGTMTNYLGTRKINTIGIRQTNKIMLIPAVAYKLRKYLKFNRNGYKYGKKG